jgi:hypothetical protein
VVVVVLLVVVELRFILALLLSSALVRNKPLPAGLEMVL